MATRVGANLEISYKRKMTRMPAKYRTGNIAVLPTKPPDYSYLFMDRLFAPVTVSVVGVWYR